MKKVLLTFIAMLAMLSVRADEYPYMIFQTTDGTIHAMAVESLSMEISNGQLVASNNEESKTFTLTDLSRMFFCTDSTGIEEVFSDDAGEVTVFTVMGVFVGKYPNANDAVKVLDGGVYLLKTKYNTIKIAVQ
ncbi:MAG: hypothetical protein K6A73_10350 [Bacteroidales bacterium]|nr:hypothetical protein [Bacteroidales bacterium]